MTIAQFIERLKKLPEDMPVCFEDPEASGFHEVDTTHVVAVEDGQDCLLLVARRPSTSRRI